MRTVELKEVRPDGFPLPIIGAWEGDAEDEEGGDNDDGEKKVKQEEGEDAPDEITEGDTF